MFSKPHRKHIDLDRHSFNPRKLSSKLIKKLCVSSRNWKVCSRRREPHPSNRPFIIHKHKKCVFLTDSPSRRFAGFISDNKSQLNSTDSNVKPFVWVETGQMHQRSDNVVDHNENTILDDNNEVS